jgi:hypothetical protein
VRGDVILELGDGDDTVEIHGKIEHSTEIHGDGGNDSALIGVTGDLNDSLLLEMGSGVNSFTSHGEIGQLYYFGGEHQDSVTLSATSKVQADARLSVDADENSINVVGSVAGTLTVVSVNDEEVVAID